MEEQYKGMTVNERLFVAGLIDQYYDALSKKDVQTLVSILEKVELAASTDFILDSHQLKR